MSTKYRSIVFQWRKTQLEGIIIDAMDTISDFHILLKSFYYLSSIVSHLNIYEKSCVCRLIDNYEKFFRSTVPTIISFLRVELGDEYQLVKCQIVTKRLCFSCKNKIRHLCRMQHIPKHILSPVTTWSA